MGSVYAWLSPYIASHPLNTQLAHYRPLELDKAGQFYAPDVALYGFAFIAEEITENAVSSHPAIQEPFERNGQSLFE